MTPNNIVNSKPYEAHDTVNSLMGIRGRLLMGFAAVAIILLVAVSGMLVIVQHTESFAAEVINTDLPIYDRLQDLGMQLYHSQSSLYAWVINGNLDEKNEYTTSWNNINRIEQVVDEHVKNWNDTSSVTNWEKVKTLIAQFRDNQTKIINLPNTGNQIDKARSLIVDVTISAGKVLDILDGPVTVTGERVGGMFDVQYESLDQGTQKILNDLSTIKIIEYALIIIIILTSIIISLLTANKIVKPLKHAIYIAKAIASGERNIHIKIASNDETGELLTALGKMQQAINDNEIKLQKNGEETRNLFENIVQTAKSFSTHSSKVAAGDLRERLEISDIDGMAQLGNDLNKMTDSLSTITKQITDASHHMVATLEEVKQAVNSQSSGATEQASSINEITASLEEIEKSSTQTMDKAKELGSVAERTREKGQQGLDAVEQSIQGMKAVRDKVQIIAQTILDLSNKTQQVGEITAVVNTLAQQSKMLALNASIEAAKAGDAGKGFAVVATEVKNLAEQSEQSTTQVQKILEDIRHATEKAVLATEEGTKGVDNGTDLVEQTGEVVRSLSEVIHEATVASQQIETAIRQEGVGIEQITAGMNEINQVTSSFVSSVKQTTEAIDNLSMITKNLKEYVDTYKI